MLDLLYSILLYIELGSGVSVFILLFFKSAPSGWLYEYISCPNYLGEIIEWIGWACLTWSLPGAIFAFFTLANLVPRAISHNQGYKKEFPEYPKKRKALIPFLL